jgi:hypothetical protein
MEVRNQNSADDDDDDEDDAEHINDSILRQLLIDIEEKGGRHHANAKRICDRKPDIYGAPNSRLRKQVGNKVSKWKHQSEEAFQNSKGRLLIRQSLSPTISRNLSSPAVVQFHPQHSTSRPQTFHSPSPFHSSPAETTMALMIPPGAGREISPEMEYIQRALTSNDYGEFTFRNLIFVFHAWISLLLLLLVSCD